MARTGISPTVRVELPNQDSGPHSGKSEKACSEKEVQITTREAEDVLVVDMVGKLDTSTSGDAYDQMVGIAQSGSRKVLVNLKDVEYMSSAGLRVILTASKLLKTARGEMRLCHPNDVVKEVLEMSGFNSLLRVHDSELDALVELHGK